MQTDDKFYEDLLSSISDSFKKNEVALIKCKNSSGEEFVALAMLSVEPVSQNIKILPFAKLWNKNPLLEISLKDYPIIVSQKELSSWSIEAINSKIDPLKLN